MDTQRRARRFGLANRWTLLSVALVVVVAAAGLYVYARGTGPGTANLSTVPVVRGPLTISVAERGSVQARQQEIIKCQVEGQTSIIFLVDEGARVKKGDLLIELDSSKLQDQQIQQQITVQNAEANFIRARENLEVVKNQAQADVAKADLDARFAVEDLRKYKEGDYPNQVRAAENKVTISDEELARATDKLKWTKRLFEEKYVSESEEKADELSQQKARLDLEVAQSELELLNKFTYKRQVDQLQSSVDQTAMALERAQRKAAADVAQAEADLKARESEFNRQKTQLEKTIQQIASCKMLAPTDGLVVYPTTTNRGGRGGMQEPLAEGATVRERQDLIYLPTASEMMATVKIHESNLDKVRVGLPVRIVIDALPGRSFTGKVAKIAPLPDGASSFMNPDLKVYNTDIYIDGDGSDLRTGMSCQAQIVVANYDDVLHVPVQSIVRVNGEPTAYVVENGKPEPRPVRIGLDNADRVLVISGLGEGERVLTAPPLPSGGGAPSTADRELAAMQVPAAATQPADADNTRAAARSGGRSMRLRSGGGNAGGGGAGDSDMRNASPSDRAAMMRQRFESITPEERQQFEQQRTNRRRQMNTDGGGPADPGTRRMGRIGSAGGGNAAGGGDGATGGDAAQP